ncbi:Ig-like domain-containing protein [Paenibacillus sp. PR3]|uniref:Ig-like domain-containing protein n=1 Tax=Paenibacillus terricola TaxID=2763503 RepID=A0ABR8N2B5_9BACL|nr:Ig-like domain-containing protein [Paenibacillus terricola]MBD3921360.1 Ig-like domain-containing protein [Paenibacillus terricola]
MRTWARIRRVTIMLTFVTMLIGQVIFGGFINVNVAQAAVNVDYNVAKKIDLSTKGLDYDMTNLTYGQFIGLPGGKVGILGGTAVGHSYSVLDSNGNKVFSLPLNTNAIMGARANNYQEIFASPMANGNTVIMWSGQPTGCDQKKGYPVQFIIVDGQGNVVQSATDISTATADYNCYISSQQLSNGNIAFVYQVTGAEYYYRIFNPTTKAFLSNPVSIEGAGATDSTYTHVLAASSNGTFMIVYHSYQATQYHVAVYQNDGTRIKAFDFAMEDTYGNGEKSLASLSNGNYALLINTLSGYQLQVFDSNGNTVGASITSGLKYTTNNGSIVEGPGVLGLGDGGFLVVDNVYQDIAPDYPGQLYVKQYNNDGTLYNNNSNWIPTGVEGSVHTYGWAFSGYDKGFGFLNWDDSKLYTFGMDTNVPVTGVTLNNSTLNLTTGGTTSTLTAAVAPSNATNKNVTWSSDNTSVATVANGVVTPVSAGTAHITVTTVDGSRTATATVTVTTPVASVTLDRTSLNLETGGATVTLIATVNPANATNKSVTWASSNAGVATVMNGIVTPVGPGTATITVTTADGGKTAACTVTVVTRVTGVTVSPTTLDLKVGGPTGTITPAVSPASATNKGITWSSDNTGVATVANGVVTAISNGTAHITATTVDGGFTAISTVNVTTPVTGVTLDKSTLNLIKGGAASTLTETVNPSTASNKGVTWVSANPSVATVTNGVVTPVGAGTTIITVTTNDGGFTAMSTVTVKTAVTGVMLDQSKLQLYKGGATGTLTATVNPLDATDQNLTWSSDDTNVATVVNGVVTAVGDGTAHITVTTVDGGYAATSEVTVTTPVTGVTLDHSTLHLFTGGADETLVATINPSDASNKAVTWSSDDTNVATVVNGVVTPIGVGTANITVTTADGGFAATSVVTVTTPVTSVTLDQPTMHLYKGGAPGTLIETVNPSDATDKSVTWSSDNTNVATVVNGVVTAVGDGTAHITVTTVDGGYTATSTVTVTTPVTGVTLDQSTLNLFVGGADETLVATVNPLDATDSSVTWSSDDANVATVVNGVVTPVGVGTATITVTTVDGGFAATSVVTVTKLATGVALDQPTMHLYKGGATGTLTATVNPLDATDKSVTWSSDDTNVATVVNGVVTAVGDGTAHITVTTVDGGYTATSTVTVTTPVTGVTLDQTTLNLFVGGADETLVATVNPLDATDPSVTWSSDDANVATVVNGVVTPVGVGTANITVTTVDGGLTATSVVTVTKPVTGVTLDQPTMHLYKGGATGTLAATVVPLDATDKSVNWSSDDTSVATVVNGVVTAVGDGTAHITATTVDGGYTATSSVTVTTPVMDVTLDQSTLNLFVGGADETLVATVNPLDATDSSVTWSSDDVNVATVVNGVVTPVGVGTANITVTTTDGGFTATSVVTVTKLATGVALDQPTMHLYKGGATGTLTATVNPLDATDKSVTWSSDDTNVATVVNGVVTAVGDGTAHITVETVDGGYTATSTVTVTTPVTGVTLDQSTLNLFVGGADETLVATVNPLDATDSSVTWSSDDANVATVANGVVTPVGVGTATITVTTADGGYTATSTVTVTKQVTGVALDQPTLSLIKGGAAGTLAATVVPLDATNTSVIWNSDDTNVATVVNGVVTPVGNGTATITATTVDGGYTATSIVTVTTPVTGVTVDKSTLDLYVGGADGALIATVNPADATDKSVTWNSDNTSVATVANGIVTPVGIGTATITVTTTDGGYTATSTVTVTKSVTGVTLDKSTLNLIKGGATETLKATVDPSDATDISVTWSSDDTNVATVVNGVVTPIGNGTATITVTTADGGYTATSTVTVTTPVLGVTLDQSTLSLTTGGTAATLSAAVNPSDASNKAVTWNSSNTSVATVVNGVVTPVSAGTATITVTTVDGSFTATSTVTVTDPVGPVTSVTNVTLDQPTLSLTTGGTAATLTATVNPSNATNKTVTWSSSNTSVATVVNGVVTPVGAGTAAITVTTVDGSFTATSTVTVTDPVGPVTSVTNVTLDQPTLSLTTGGTAATLIATVNPSNATNKTVTWSSSNTSVATVVNGVVTPVGAGTATITVTTVDGSFTATSTVTVTDPVGPVTSVTNVTLDQPTLSLTTGGTAATLIATVNPSNATNKTVTWSSSNTNVATVVNGVVTPVGAGTVTITATTVDGSFTATSIVTVTDPVVPPTSVTSVTLDQSTLSLTTSGTAATLTATVNPSNATNKTVTWSSSNTSVATVVNGVVTPVGAGTATITATTVDGSFTATSIVTVTDPVVPPTSVTSVTLDQSTLSLTTSGTAATLTATVNPSNATNKTVTWSSSNTSVATVVNGVVTPVGAGTATITVTTVDGSFTATSIVTVTDPTNPVTSVKGVSLNHKTLSLTVGGAAATLNATVTPGNATNKNVTWSSSNTSVATVVNGVVTPVGTGTATITVTTVDGRFTATSIVTVSNPDPSPGTGTTTAPDDGFEVLVNGKPESAGKVTTKEENGRKETTVTVDTDKLENRLASEGQGAVVTIPVPVMTDSLVVVLNGEMVSKLNDKNAVVVIQTDRATYTIPADQINIGAISDQLGNAIDLKDIQIQVKISEPLDAMKSVVKNAAGRGKFTVVAPPLDFSIQGIYGNSTVEISKFDVYVERLLLIPDGVDPSKITTGIVVEPDGTFRHVPTQVLEINGKHYAAINSLTNSTYSLVWHPVTFSDVNNHWSKDAVNDMGSRLIIEGVGNDLFQPNRDITRAEFAAIIVRALGLELESGKAPFSDVTNTAWYNDVINTAYKYELINGFEDGTFRPSDLITREQAMVMIAKAMKLTGLKAKLPSQSVDISLESFEDALKASAWALDGIADSVQAGIVTGRNGSELAPKDNITRAEVAAIIQRLLQKSDLI